jgi:hypothetical protein
VAGEPAFALRGVGAAVGENFALRDVSFELPTGYVMGLVGANGAGKTTLIRCLLGMRGIDTGEIELLGHRVPGPVALRQDVGVVLDRTYLVGDWRLTEVERTLRPFYDRWDSARYRSLLDEFALDPRARVGDHLTLLHAGRVVRTGPKDDILAAYRVVRGGPDDLTGLVGVELIGVRRTGSGAQALVRTEEACFVDGDVLVEAPTLEEIALHVGAPAPRRTGVGA